MNKKVFFIIIIVSALFCGLGYYFFISPNGFEYYLCEDDDYTLHNHVCEKVVTSKTIEYTDQIGFKHYTCPDGYLKNILTLDKYSICRKIVTIIPKIYLEKDISEDDIFGDYVRIINSSEGVQFIVFSFGYGGVGDYSNDVRLSNTGKEISTKGDMNYYIYGKSIEAVVSFSYDYWEDYYFYYDSDSRVFYIVDDGKLYPLQKL